MAERTVEEIEKDLERLNKDVLERHLIETPIWVIMTDAEKKKHHKLTCELVNAMEREGMYK